MFGFLAQLLAWCYDVWGNYAFAIVLFTLIVMAAVTPFTIKGMRSAAEMARIQPEMKKLQDQYKNDKLKQNEEVQALFKEHGVNPLGGCLPAILPLPIFFIIFRLLERLPARHNGAFAPLVRLVRHQVGGSAGYVSPHYLAYTSTFTQHLIRSNGAMRAFGFDLSLAARSHHPTAGSAIPYYGLIVIMTVSQYWQQRQINQRNPAAANANPQMKVTMQLFPAFYAVISLSIPASVVFYLLVSGLFRMGQNALSYRFDPVMARAAVSAGTIETTARAKVDGGATGAGGPTGAAKAALTANGGSGRAQPSRPGSARPASGRPGSGGESTARRGSRAGAGAGAAKTGAAGGGFLERLRSQAADARARTDEARVAAKQSGPSGPGRSAGSAKQSGQAKRSDGAGQRGRPGLNTDRAKSNASRDQRREPPSTKTADGGRRGMEGDAVQRRGPDRTETNGAGQNQKPPGRPATSGAPPDGTRSRSPLSVRPSGRRPKKGQ